MRVIGGDAGHVILLCADAGNMHRSTGVKTDACGTGVEIEFRLKMRIKIKD